MNITITQERVDAIVCEQVASQLAAITEQLAERHISERIGMLTLEQAARHLQCKNVRQCVDFCREHKIPVCHFGPKKRFVRIKDIEAAQARVAWVPHSNLTTTTSTK